MTARADSSTCSTKRVGIPFGPCQWAGSVSQPTAPKMPSISAQPAARDQPVVSRRTTTSPRSRTSASTTVSTKPT